MRSRKIFTIARIILFAALLVGTLMSAGTAAAQEEGEDCSDIYTVVSGDTLGRIAARCGTTVSRLMIVNPEIEDPHWIYRGQKLNIPDRAEAGLNPDKERVLEELDIEAGERWIDVDLSGQVVHAYEGEQVVRSFVVSTGTWRYPTVVGQFNVRIKLEDDDMSGPGYDLEDVPYVMYFHKGYALHGTYWHDNFGTPMSHGCVNLRVEDAAWLFDFASEGTLVNVHQ